MNRLSHTDFINRLKENDIDVTPLEEYINDNTKILCKCNKCDYTWEVKPNNLFAGNKCPNCSKHKRWTEDEFLSELKNIHGDTIQVIDKFINMKTDINCKCLKCNKIWTTTPGRLIYYKHGCINCNSNKKKTNEDFLEELFKINPNIQPLEEYINSKTKILCKCNICGYEWRVSPTHLLYSKSGCKNCAWKYNGKQLRKDPEIFKSELNQINPTIELLTDYVRTKDKVKVRCLICNHEWCSRPSDLLRGTGCPCCSISNGELIIMNYLNNHNILFFYDIAYFDDLYGTSGKRLLRPDFILPELNIWIEFDGRQHFEPVNFKNNKDKEGAYNNFNIIKQNDLIKENYAIENGWMLIRISYLEYDNIENILDEYLYYGGNNDD